MNPRRTVIAAGTLALLVLGVAYAIVIPGPDDGHRVPFDSARWRARALDGDPQWPTRLRMADDLVTSKALDLLRRDDVERLLGPGDQTDEWPDWDLAYSLGPQRSGAPGESSAWLVIRFDSSGRVETYRLTGD